MQISIGRRENLEAQPLNEMHKLRARIFKDKKSWDVNVICEMEIDGYDALNPYYMIITPIEDKSYVYGCWRILPTTGPNMLAHTFPELLHGAKAPCSDKIWELSRFALEAPEKNVFNFSEGSAKAIGAIVKFAMDNNITQFVTVTTIGIEKMLTRLGLDIARFGPPIKIGIENAIALKIKLNEKTWNAIKK